MSSNSQLSPVEQKFWELYSGADSQYPYQTLRDGIRKSAMALLIEAHPEMPADLECVITLISERAKSLATPTREYQDALKQLESLWTNETAVIARIRGRYQSAVIASKHQELVSL